LYKGKTVSKREEIGDGNLPAYLVDNLHIYLLFAKNGSN